MPFTCYALFIHRSFAHSAVGTTCIMSIIRFIHVSQGSTAAMGRRDVDTAMLYICALCLVDFLVLLTIPLTIVDQIMGFWIFGQAAILLLLQCTFTIVYSFKIYLETLLVMVQVRYCANCITRSVRLARSCRRIC